MCRYKKINKHTKKAEEMDNGKLILFWLLCVLKVKSVKTINTPEEKLNWIFTAFDSDGGGSIDVEEIKEIVLGCFR